MKSKLRAGHQLCGCWLETYNPVVTQIIAQAGYDVGMIDLEHGPGSYLDAQSVMPALEMSGCLPVIRIPFAHEAEIKKAMDIGPAGIMVPNIRSAVEARYMVEACHYAPGGIRGAAPGIIRATQYGKNLENYAEFLDQDFLLIGQIESLQAVDQIDSIASIEGLDMLFIGPADLSASLGELGNFTSEKFISSINKIEEAAKKTGKLLGTIPIGSRSAKQLFESGYDFVVSATDTLLLQKAALDDVEHMHRVRIDANV